MGHSLIMKPDVLIVGAGIIGAACADALSAQGLRVTVIERDAVGSGATAAGMGHLVAMDDNAAELALSSHSLELWKALVEGQAQRHEYSNCGTIWVAADDEELEAARSKAVTMSAHGLHCGVIGAKQLYSLEPQLRPGLAGGLLVQGDALVYPPKSARILLARAVARGATLLMGDVVALEHGGVVLADGSRLAAGQIVLAGGTRCLSLAPELPLRPKKGHVMITDRYPGFIRHQLVELGYIKSAHASEGESVAFNLQPRPTGQVLIGSSRQFDTVEMAAEPAVMARMLARAVEYAPALAGLNVLRCWTGLRAATPDGLPLIGPDPSRNNVWLATGHEGLGITTSLATAELLASQMVGSRAGIDAQPYLPSRFNAQGRAYG